MSKLFDISKAARNLKSKHSEENIKLERRRGDAQKLAKEITDLMIAADSTLNKIIGFGSTFETWRKYRIDSDIDIAIIGGNLEKLEKVLPESDYDISIIELENQSENFQSQVLKNGTVLYEK